MAIEVFNRYEKKYMLNAIQYEIWLWMRITAISRSMKSATFIMIHQIMH